MRGRDERGGEGGMRGEERDGGEQQAWMHMKTNLQ